MEVIDILSTLSLLIHEHYISLHLFRSSLIFQAIFYRFYCVRSVQLLLNSSICILFLDSIVNCIDLYINFNSEYIREKLIFMLILYPVILLNLLISDSSFFFLIGSLGVTIYTIMSSANKNKSSFFTICRRFIYFFALLHWLEPPVERTLDTSSKSWHLRFVPNFKKKQLDFHHLADVSCNIFLDGLFKVEEIFLYFCVTESFYYVWVLNFVKNFLHMIDHFLPLSFYCIELY